MSGFPPPTQDFNKNPSCIAIAQILVRAGISGIQLVPLPTFITFFINEELVVDKDATIESISQLSKRNVLIEKCVKNEKKISLIRDGDTRTRIVEVRSYYFKSFLDFIDFLKKNKHKHIFLWVAPEWNEDYARMHVTMFGNSIVRMAIVD